MPGRRRPGRRGRAAAHAHRPVRRARHRLAVQDPARPRARRRTGADQHRRDPPQTLPDLRGGARRRRDRRRVRVRLALLRGRGHRRRGARPPRARARTRRPRRPCCGRSASAGSRCARPARCVRWSRSRPASGWPSTTRTARRWRRTSSSSPSAAGRVPRGWATRRPAWRSTAATSRSTSGCETSVPGVYAVGDLVLGLQLAHRGFAHGIFVAEDVAHRTGRLDRAPVLVARRADPARHLLRPRGRVGRAERGGGRGPASARSRRRRTTSPATARPRSCRPRASSSSSAAPTDPSSASTWSGPGSAS